MATADLGSLLSQRAERSPDAPFVSFVEDGRTFTFAEFDSAVNRVANGLAETGVERESPVCLMLPNGFEYLSSAYALKKLGGVEVAVNAEFRGPGLARMIGLTQAETLIASPEFLEVLAPLADDLSHVRTVVVTGSGDATRAAESAFPGRIMLSFDEFESSDARDPRVSVSDASLASIMFTSGTSGVSKGCMLSHRLAVHSAQAVVEALSLTKDDCVYTPYPLHHMRAAYLDLLPALLVGARAAIARRFSASRIWGDLRECKATTFSLIGTVMRILWNAEPNAADRDHDVRITWGGPISVDPMAFEERFGIRVLPGEGVYGMTEVGLVSMSSFDPARTGRVREVLEVRIAGSDDAELPRGELGEILIRPREPDVIFKGYYGMPEATLEAFRNLWFHTGDLGRLDGEGRLSFLGRGKEMIRRAGHNISTWEVEEIVAKHPSVAECAAVGVPSELGEEEVKVYVEVRPGASVSAAEIRDWCHDQMAAFMVPAFVELIDELPRTSTGKVAKTALTHSPAATESPA